MKQNQRLLILAILAILQNLQACKRHDHVYLKYYHITDLKPLGEEDTIVEVQGDQMVSVGL